MKRYTCKYFFLFVIIALGQQVSIAQEHDLEAILASTDISQRDSIAYELFKIYRQSNTTKAFYYARIANKLSLTYKHSVIHAKSWLALGYMADKTKQIDSAIYFNRQGVRFAKANAMHDRLMYFYNDLGNLFERVDLYDSSLAYYHLSFNIAQLLNSYYDQAITKNNIGLVHYHLSNYKEAAENLKEAIQIKDRHGIQEGIELNHLNLAIVLNDQGLFNEALPHLKVVESICKKGECNTSTLADLNYGIGYSNLKTRNIDEAYSYFLNALQFARKINNDQKISSILINIASIQFTKKNYPAALEHLDQAYPLSRKSNSRRQLRDIYELYSNVYKEKGDLESALIYKDYYINMKDSVFNMQLAENLKNIELSVHRRQADQIIAQKDDELSRGRTIIILTIAMTVLVLSLLFVIWRNLALEKRLKSKLSDQVAERTAELKQSNIEIQKSYAEYDHLVYRISHDIRGPITTVLGLTHVALLDTRNPDTITEYLSKIKQSASGLSVTLSKLTEVNTLRNSPLEIIDVDIQKLIDNILPKFASEPMFSLVNLRFSHGQLKHGLKTDSRFLGFIIENCLSNAYRYVDHNRPESKAPYIHIHWEQDDLNTTISIEDNGVGIAEESKTKLFQLFFVASPNHGPGLGLFLSQMAAGRLGGKLFLSRNMNPTVFKLVITNDLSRSIGTFTTNPFYKDHTLADVAMK
jgi:signal transduction histidine kinase/Tfp pilus assembly protein PilF